MTLRDRVNIRDPKSIFARFRGLGVLEGKVWTSQETVLIISRLLDGKFRGIDILRDRVDESVSEGLAAVGRRERRCGPAAGGNRAADEGRRRDRGAAVVVAG